MFFWRDWILIYINLKGIRIGFDDKWIDDLLKGGGLRGEMVEELK